MRYSDRPLPMATRLLGLVGTALVCLVLIGAGLLRWVDAPRPRASTAALTLVEIAPSRAPPAPPSERTPGPEQVERQSMPERASPRAAPMSRPALPIIALVQPAIGLPRPEGSHAVLPASDAKGGQPAARAAAPEARPVPPAPKATDERPQWERLVLAALHRAKRYPRAARRNGDEGTSWIRFVIDRRGRVRSAALHRSSGIASLDREALALPARAQPLPRPPKTVTGSRIELVVPIEFFLRSSQ
ncbi:energy transducer TonB [Sphingopyxis sp. NJF-3]